MKDLWICGTYVSGDFPVVAWEFNGVFSTKELAVARCQTWKDFVARYELDVAAPVKTVPMPDAFYPLEGPEEGEEGVD
ncbi:hypothetical protein LCGC14_1099080 [marine sediment metagenome]|uniref:Uncharacterized protein n=1 Tax=marine sediment metagenome TaxID=412755 RepID=A0A0F9MEK7_9ZZZZ